MFKDIISLVYLKLYEPCCKITHIWHGRLTFCCRLLCSCWWPYTVVSVKAFADTGWPCYGHVTGIWRVTWWRHQIETFSAFLAICAGISKVTGDFPAHYDVIKWKHFPRCWPFDRGIHRSPIRSHKLALPSESYVDTKINNKGPFY